MVKVQKIAGEYPALVIVGPETASFDLEGVADVSEEAAGIFRQLPAEYAVEGEDTAQEPQGDAVADDAGEDKEDEQEAADELTEAVVTPDEPAAEPAAPVAKPAPRRKAAPKQ